MQAHCALGLDVWPQRTLPASTRLDLCSRALSYVVLPGAPVDNSRVWQLVFLPLSTSQARTHHRSPWPASPKACAPFGNCDIGTRDKPV